MNTVNRLHIYFALLIPTTVLGFWITWFGIFNDLPAKVTPVPHVHAMLMFLWLLMLIAQGWFIRTKRFHPHRDLAPAMRSSA